MPDCLLSVFDGHRHHRPAFLLIKLQVLANPSHKRNSLPLVCLLLFLGGVGRFLFGPSGFLPSDQTLLSWRFLLIFGGLRREVIAVKEDLSPRIHAKGGY